MKKIHPLIKVLFVILLLASLVALIFFIEEKKQTDCPDELFYLCVDQDQCTTPLERYYYKDSTRKEYDEYNKYWVKYICQIKPELIEPIPPGLHLVSPF